MKRKKGWYLLLKLVAFVGIILLTMWLFNQYYASNLPYGKKANDVRIALNVPTIKPSMYSSHITRNTIGNHWKNFWDNPDKGEVLHVWKIAIPESDDKTLSEERDGFRKRLDNGVVYQLNIVTNIENNQVIEQYGILFQTPSSYESRKEVSGSKLDSIISDWKILEQN